MQGVSGLQSNAGSMTIMWSAHTDAPDPLAVMLGLFLGPRPSALLVRSETPFFFATDLT